MTFSVSSEQCANINNQDVLHCGEVLIHSDCFSLLKDYMDHLKHLQLNHAAIGCLVVFHKDCLS